MTTAAHPSPPLTILSARALYRTGRPIAPRALLPCPLRETEEKSCPSRTSGQWFFVLWRVCAN